MRVIFDGVYGAIVALVLYFIGIEFFSWQWIAIVFMALIGSVISGAIEEARHR